MSLEIDVAQANVKLAEMSAIERIQWAHSIAGEGLAATTSGGETSMMLPYLMREAGVEAPIIFIDIEGYTLDTYAMIAHLEKDSFDIRKFTQKVPSAQLRQQWGDDWKTDEVRYKNVVKAEPMQRALEKLEVTLLLRGLTGYKPKGLPDPVEEAPGTFYLHPILQLSQGSVINFIRSRALPINYNHFDPTKDKYQTSNSCPVPGIGSDTKIAVDFSI